MGTPTDPTPALGPQAPFAFPPAAPGVALAWADRNQANADSPNDYERPMQLADGQALCRVCVDVGSVPAAPEGGQAWLLVSVYRFYPTPKRQDLFVYRRAVAAYGAPISFAFEWPAGVNYWVCAYWEVDAPAPDRAGGLTWEDSGLVLKSNGLGWSGDYLPAADHVPDPPDWAESYEPLDAGS